MPFIKEPKPLPSDLAYVPPGSAAYRVTDDDNWWILAERPEVKAAGMTAGDLCQFNFKTRKPGEINWYLYHKVGCRRSTRNGKNYMFSKVDSPGIVYLPKLGPPPPVTELTAKKPSERTNAWFGVGINVGTQFAVVGIDTLEGYVASLDDPGKGIALHATTNRVGPGWGASGGVNFIYVTGVRHASQLNGHQQGDVDFNLSLGANWGKAGKAASKISRLQPLIDVLKKTGAKSPSALKKVLGSDPDKWGDLVKAGKTVKDFAGGDSGAEPNVLIFGVPYAGGGVEASVFYGLSNFEAAWDFTE
jgi:hypothetical protein